MGIRLFLGKKTIGESFRIKVSNINSNDVMYPSPIFSSKIIPRGAKRNRDGEFSEMRKSGCEARKTAVFRRVFGKWNEPAGESNGLSSESAKNWT